MTDKIDQIDPHSDTHDRVCGKCKKWVYYDNGDVTYHCGCRVGWTWSPIGG